MISRPLSPGCSVSSTFTTLTSRSSPHSTKLSHSGWRFWQAGHHEHKILSSTLLPATLSSSRPWWCARRSRLPWARGAPQSNSGSTATGSGRLPEGRHVGRPAHPQQRGGPTSAQQLLHFRWSVCRMSAARLAAAPSGREMGLTNLGLVDWLRKVFLLF